VITLAGLLFAVAAGSSISLVMPATARDLDSRLREAEARRIAVIEKIKPSVAAVFAAGGQGGGSGVVISKDGYALTNFHVVQGSGPVMQCGLPDGVLYDSVVVGEDKVGDVALIKLLPKKPGQEFPAVKLGDSDKVKAGDWSLAMGNPFLLATDFAPTVTFGLVSGVHRYQYPEGSKGLLEYTDCIQVDTSINPGNSGGPLFNIDGELIGINGRISLEKRGRVNSGVGYAISINQIKNFMGHLRAGLDADHASLGALVSVRQDENQPGMVVSSILEECDARRRGLDLNDELVSFAGRGVANPNQYQNILGVFPKGWRVPLVYRRENEKKEILVRLMGVQRHEIDDGKPKPAQPATPPPPPSKSPAAKLFQAKEGFANAYFNKVERDRLWAGFRKFGDFSSLGGTWTIDGDFELLAPGKRPMRVTIGNERSADGKRTPTIARLDLGGVHEELDPLKTGQSTDSLRVPTGSGGMLMALYHYRRLLVQGEKGFEQSFTHGGYEPIYVMPADGSKPKNLMDVRLDTEVLRTEHSSFAGKWFFRLKEPIQGGKTAGGAELQLLACEMYIEKDEDPCELYFSDYRSVEGKELPHRIEVRYKNDRYGVFTIKSYQLAAAK
jgi:S1-C subfamily serine protease